MKSRLKTGLLLAVMAAMLTACFWNDDVTPSGVGVISDGGALDTNCLSPGLHTDGRFYSHLIEVNMAALTFPVEDTSVATADTQLVGVKVSVTIQRSRDCNEIHDLLTNWSSLVSDDALIAQAQAQVSQGIKVAVRKYTLNQLLDDRTGVAEAIKNDLQVVADKFSTNVINVSVVDIVLDPTYEAKLETKAQVTIDIEIAQRNQDKVKAEQETARIEQQQRAETLEAKLLAEQAQTSVDVEIASREGKKVDAANKVYQTNEQAFELERLRQLKGLLSETDKIYFVPEGTDLTLLLSGLQGTAVPVPLTNP